MTQPIVVTGTDTGIGKTVFAAALADALGASYWKPIQAGLMEETDSETAARLGRIPPHRLLPEAWRLRTPVSPHLSAHLDGITLQPDRLTPPDGPLPLVIEGAGGLLVPLTRTQTLADVFARWRYPVILCARTALGTLNHTLLSLEALRHRHIPVLGVAFIGDPQTDTMEIVRDISGTRLLGRLPHLDPLTPDSLRRAFRDHIDLSAIQEASA